jgi:hypothetical protein
MFVRGITVFSRAGLKRSSSIIFSIFSLMLVSGSYAGQAGLETPAPSGEDSQSLVAGSVSLVLGKAFLIHESGRELLQKGASVHVGDKVYTEQNGHVHIRFIDDALVSVRPQSTLLIERYEYNPLNPENSAVKFDLNEGVVRSISGGAARAAKNRFRLNTPVAAIGVRGTDFVVNANSFSTRALVNEGVIVVAPFSSLCSSTGLGPCADNAVELAGDSFQVLEISGSTILPIADVGRPPGQVADLRDRFRLAAGPDTGGSDDARQSDASAVYLEARSSDKVSEASAAIDISGGLETNIPPDFTPQTTLDTTGASLAWGRFSSDLPNSAKFLSVDRATAAEGRTITIAAGNYLLYRSEPNGPRVDSNLGKVGFDLSSAQAFYDSPDSRVAMRVAGGDLTVDFVDNEFSTILRLDHALTGPFDFSGGGRVADGGYLLGLGDGKSVVGAVATDGREAGYFFEQQLQSGSINGLTLWSSQ